MQDLLKTIPNQLTAARLILLPVLWVFAWLKMPAYIGIGMLVCGLTDVLDGYIARKFNQTSKMGAKFDAFADNLQFPSALIWLWIFQPDLYKDNAFVCILGVTLYFASLLLGLIKFKQLANLHLFSTKIAALAMYVFIPHALITGQYNQTFFYIAIILFLISSIESFILQIISSEVTEHMGSLLLVLKNRKSI